jgi:tetratricopeptide (TPR) repeat protein
MPRIKSTHVDDAAAAGRRLRGARERARLSQRRLAFPGCSPSYISRIEAGERIASPLILRKLAERLGVTERFLATGDLVTPLTLLEDAEMALRLDDTVEAARLFETALKDARGDGERARAYEGLGQVAFRSGDPALAVELFEKTLALVGNDVAARPALADSLARAYAALGELARAIAILERSLEASADDPVQYVRFAVLLGAALTDSGSFADAERVLAAALLRGKDVSDPYTRARLYWSEARLRGEQGQKEQATKYLLRTIEILRTTEDTYALAHALQSLAHAYLDLDRPRQALELLCEGEEFILDSGTPLEIAQYRIEEARALAGLGDMDEAATLAIDAGNALQGTHPVDAGRTYALLGEIFLELGEDFRAREVLELAIDQLERQAPNRYLVQAYKQLASLLRARGDKDAALDVLERALSVHERAGRPIN